MTGFEQYVGIKSSYYFLLWTEKTAFVHLQNGTEFLNITLQDYILDMSGSYGFIYVLTQNGIFQYLRSNFELVATINAIFDQNSKI